MGFGITGTKRSRLTEEVSRLPGVILREPPEMPDTPYDAAPGI
jgi:hypothetical protein